VTKHDREAAGFWVAAAWAEVRKLRLKGQAHMMSDERILGESEFVDSVLSQSGETYDRHDELKRRGYDLERIAERVAEVYGMEKHEVFSIVVSLNFLLF
jgi:hypothetical protein